MEFCVWPAVKSCLTKICAFKLFKTPQCNPFKPVCPTKDFLLDKSDQNSFFKANLMINVKNDQNAANLCFRL